MNVNTHLAGAVIDEEALDGDGHADPELDALVARFQHRVGYFARRIEQKFGLCPSGRDDLVSAGYWGLLKALQNRRADAHDHELSAYVSKRVEGAVIDEARMTLKRASNRADCDPADLETGSPLESYSLDWENLHCQSDPEHLADRQARWRSIERSFEHLTTDHRELLLAYASGASLAEIARTEGGSPARLQNQMGRITRAVRAQSPDLRRLLRFEI